jgi:hypothetical protein
MTQQVKHDSIAASSSQARQPHQLEHGGAPGEVLVHSRCGHCAAGAAAEAQEGGCRQVARQPRVTVCGGLQQEF